MMNRWTKGLIAGVLVIGMTGCNEEMTKQEVQQYNGQAFEEGTQEAQSEGRGLNGKFLDSMKQRFEAESMELTNETVAEESDGSMIYRYLINNDQHQQLNLHVYPDEQTRSSSIKDLYSGNDAKGEEGLKSVVVESEESAVVYLAAGELNADYQQHVEKIGPQLLEEIATSANESNNIEEDDGDVYAPDKK
ncbi:hypothetical protein [Paenibacillus lemnae]|uniref:Uncharacterized protein n=1 Tax=Paenibacillus lemnae TaxID=1330551 RepID=A0A848M844_PAELE|nr:hypothetical protein [Paenibacillus lemnae]NMO96252.1 hypothetical protein [Paenibacillus lemnae]